MQYIIKNKKIIFDALLFIFAAIILFLVRDNLRSIITPFIYALVLAYLLNPLVNFLEKKEQRLEKKARNILAGNTQRQGLTTCHRSSLLCSHRQK